MKAVVYKSKGNLEITSDYSYPNDDEKKEIILPIKAAALNHRDVWISKGMYPGLVSNTILGSDGCGMLDGICYLINPSLNWGTNPKYYQKDYQILGMPTNGTFAEYIRIPYTQLYKKPAHLNFEEAASIPLAGLTAFRTLFTKAKLQATDKVFISGIGGGVALMAFQFAVAHGNEVYVSSGDEQKISKAIRLGAKGGVNYKNPNWSKELLKLSNGIDVAIDGAGGKGFGQIVQACNPLARIVIYGGTGGLLNDISPQSIFWKQLEIHGSTMGNDLEFADMLAFITTHKIYPIIDSVYPLNKALEAFKKMENGKQFGKLILKI